VFTGGLGLRGEIPLQDPNVIGPLEAFRGLEFAPADDAPEAPDRIVIPVRHTTHTGIATTTIPLSAVA